MFTLINAQRTPYGAYELKASYQRNLLFGQLVLMTLLTLGLTGPSIYRALFGDTMVVIPIDPKPEPIEVKVTLPNPPSVERENTPVQLSAPPPQQTVTNQVVAVADSTWNDTEPEEMLPSRTDLSDYNVAGDTGSVGNGIDTSALLGDDYFPKMDEWVPTEEPPKMIDYKTPEYPSIARATGTTGRVVVKALIDKDGKVIDARVYVSSGSSILDDAAIRAAYRNVFSPGIQNGTPVRCWVTYTVDFKLDH